MACGMPVNALAGPHLSTRLEAPRNLVAGQPQMYGLLPRDQPVLVPHAPGSSFSHPTTGSYGREISACCGLMRLSARGSRVDLDIAYNVTSC